MIISKLVINIIKINFKLGIVSIKYAIDVREIATKKLLNIKSA